MKLNQSKQHKHGGLIKQLLGTATSIVLLLAGACQSIAADIGTPYRIYGPPVAANPVDRRVLLDSGAILVITNTGQVFVHPETRNGIIAQAYRLVGPPVASLAVDKHVLRIGNRLLVITNDGGVFAHNLIFAPNSTRLSGIGRPYQLRGPLVAARPEDRWVVEDDSRILVITNNGSVFAHDVTTQTVGNPYRLYGPPVAANNVDRHVLVFRGKIYVITTLGEVFVHLFNRYQINSAFKLTGPRVAANPVDRYVRTDAGRLLVITRDGSVFVHSVP